MKNSIVIGPIQKAKKTDTRHNILTDRLSKMKVGNYFEITGISAKADAQNIRASICYVSKKEGVKVATQLNGSVLRVERIKASRETKSTDKV